ncbi:MAG: hypothetical protein IJJ57_04875, partial [Ruminococcus sp.]|nr:hypothetical protein [Ruminococcus sp.]
MKKLRSLISISTCAAAVLAAVPFSASAADTVYGTMNIPYADFYAAEIGNAYEVDAVSSATATKWKGNNTGSVGEDGKWQNGGLVAGTYNDDNGTILGVTYPVAVSSDDVTFLTENYGFTALDSAPVAYKEVSVSDGKITVSAVKDTNGEQTADGELTLATTSAWGDYQISVKGYPTDCDLYGITVNTSDGSSYALRHLENIWRNGSYSWSTGFKTSEAHGNELKYEDFVSIMGKTITSVKFITLDGYTTVNTGSVYVPVKFDGGVTADNGKAGTGSTTYTSTVPSDFEIAPSVDEGMSAADGTISYTDAKPGKYNITLNDSKGKYAPVSASFTLETADVPVKYEDGKLTTADGFTDEDAANFIKNLTTAAVNDNTYNASGRGAVKVINEDGTVNFEAAAGAGRDSAGTPVFAEDGKYKIVLTATGYTTPYSFEVTKGAVEEPTQEATEAPATT